MNQSIGTAKRVTSSGAVFTTAVNVSTITVTAKGGDVNVQFLDGNAGTCLWAIEADASSGSHSVSFPSPILFSSGVYVVADVPDFLESICVAVV